MIHIHNTWILIHAPADGRLNQSEHDTRSESVGIPWLQFPRPPWGVQRMGEHKGSQYTTHSVCLSIYPSVVFTSISASTRRSPTMKQTPFPVFFFFQPQASKIKLYHPLLLPRLSRLRERKKVERSTYKARGRRRTETVWQQVHRGHLECWTELTNWVFCELIQHAEERRQGGQAENEEEV